jgi:hypothetical protein
MAPFSLKIMSQSAVITMAGQWGLEKANVETQRKLSESVWKMLFYLTSFGWGTLLVARRDWTWINSYDALFDHVPTLYAAPDSIDGDIRLFYLFELGFYVHSVYAHVAIEIRRKDFVEMLVHHVATFALIAISYSTRFVAVGTLIVCLHDLSDILLETAKQYIYLGRETMANLWFAIWVLSWIVLRLVYFPFFILPGSLWISPGKIGRYPHWASCAVMLIVLQILHIFWTWMIARMIWRMFAGGDKVRDTREDDNTDESSKED